MSITDERLKSKALKAIDLQEQGRFVVDYRHELPIPNHPSLEHLRRSFNFDEQGRYYDLETDWGKFSFVPENYSNLLILRKGTPPSELLPQPKLQVATATAHAGYVSIHNNGKSFDLDFQSCDQVDYSMLRMVNQTLAGEGIPVVVWQLDEAKDETPPIIRITNESAMLFASSAIWSPQDQQLVAAQVVTTSQDLLKAIKATLANSNSKSYLTVKTPEDSAYLKSARRGFVSVSNSLVQANAEGTVTAMQHPLSGDPQANSEDHFFIVVAPGENVRAKFAERLDLAIPWPVQQEWSDYLLEAGKKAGLVEILPNSGNDFSSGIRVTKNETLWQQLISGGLKKGQIKIQ